MGSLVVVDALVPQLLCLRGSIVALDGWPRFLNIAARLWLERERQFGLLWQHPSADSSGSIECTKLSVVRHLLLLSTFAHYIIGMHSSVYGLNQIAPTGTKQLTSMLCWD